MAQNISISFYGKAGLRLMGDLESLEQFVEDNRFLEGIRPELQNKYPNRWVAVYKKEVVGDAKSISKIIKMLKSKGVPVSQSVLVFLRKKPIPMIL